VAQAVSSPAAAVSAAWHPVATLAVVIAAQQICKAAQFVPVEVVVVVLVVVAVLVVVSVDVQTGLVQAAPAPVSVQACRLNRQVMQGCPAAVARVMLQLVSQAVAVASQGHAIMQLIQSAHAPPAKLPLA
jgi:hypothetical protein